MISSRKTSVIMLYYAPSRIDNNFLYVERVFIHFLQYSYCGAVSADIQSSNIVGYANGVEGVQQFNFIGIGFSQVGFNTCDIQQLKLSDGGAGTIGWGGESFSIWAGAPAVVEGSDAFVYWDASMDPSMKATECYWGDGDCVASEFSVQPGQGVVVQMGTDGIGVQTAGEVNGEPVTLTGVEMFNFLANPFPMAIDIQNIKISDDGAGTIGWGGESFSIWSGAPEVVEGSDAFVYWDASMDPNMEATEGYWGDGDCVKATYPIACGQSFVIQAGAAGLEFTITPPFSL